MYSFLHYFFILTTMGTFHCLDHDEGEARRGEARHHHVACLLSHLANPPAGNHQGGKPAATLMA